MLNVIKDNKILYTCIIVFIVFTILFTFLILQYNKRYFDILQLNCNFQNINNFNVINVAKSGVINEEIKIDEEGVIDFKSLKLNREESKVNTVIINSPVIEIKKDNNSEENYNSLNEAEIPQNNNEKNGKFIRFEKNEDMIAKIESTILVCVPLEWFTSGSKIVIDTLSSDKINDYILYEKLDQEYLKNKKSGDIKIYAVDEIWKKDNKEYVLQTRCYIKCIEDK